MKISLTALAVATVFASAASGATLTSTPGAPDPGPAPGEITYIDFDSALPTGVTLTGGLIQSGSNGMGAAPAGDATRYLAVTGTATLDFTAALAANPGTAIQTLSFYWGSIDGYNDLDLLGVGGAVFQTFNGGTIPPANGNQAIGVTNQRVFITLGAGETLTGLRFRSTQAAFELDDVSASVGAVPEPTSWALMIAGFGLVGVAMRRRSGLAVVAA